MSDKDLSLYASFAVFKAFLFKTTGSNFMLVAGYTLLKIGFKHLKRSHVHYSLEHFLSLLVFFITFRSMVKYVKKNQ